MKSTCIWMTLCMALLAVATLNVEATAPAKPHEVLNSEEGPDDLSQTQTQTAKERNGQKKKAKSPKAFKSPADVWLERMMERGGDGEMFKAYKSPADIWLEKIAEKGDGEMFKAYKARRHGEQAIEESLAENVASLDERAARKEKAGKKEYYY